MTLRQFTELKQRVNKLVDKLGRPVDPGILDTVTILRAYGIHTIGSCEGHVDRTTGGPFVMFEAPGVRKDTEVLRAIGDRLSPKYKKIYKKATEESMKEIQKILKLLDDFYAARVVLVDQRLIVQYFGPTTGKLMCQGAYLGDILTRKDNAKMLKKIRLKCTHSRII